MNEGNEGVVISEVKLDQPAVDAADIFWNMSEKALLLTVFCAVLFIYFYAAAVYYPLKIAFLPVMALFWVRLARKSRAANAFVALGALCAVGYFNLQFAFRHLDFPVPYCFFELAVFSIPAAMFATSFWFPRGKIKLATILLSLPLLVFCFISAKANMVGLIDSFSNPISGYRELISRDELASATEVDKVIPLSSLVKAPFQSVCLLQGLDAEEGEDNPDYKKINALLKEARYSGARYRNSIVFLASDGLHLTSFSTSYRLTTMNGRTAIKNRKRYRLPSNFEPCDYVSSEQAAVVKIPLRDGDYLVLGKMNR
ncbi:MAG TPA: hypothetical protein DD435_15915 [Cyanobacteria bacterium UBA8530]|nr:hypothetical protein [Cyanobacteria bacterium UBA8530]